MVSTPLHIRHTASPASLETLVAAAARTDYFAAVPARMDQNSSAVRHGLVCTGSCWHVLAAGECTAFPWQGRVNRTHRILQSWADWSQQAAGRPAGSCEMLTADHSRSSVADSKAFEDVVHLVARGSPAAQSGVAFGTPASRIMTATRGGGHLHLRRAHTDQAGRILDCPYSPTLPAPAGTRVAGMSQRVSRQSACGRPVAVAPMPPPCLLDEELA